MPPINPPTLNTQRLVLRPLSLADAPRVAVLCADKRMAQYTLTLPHPYTLADAEWWLGQHEKWHAAGEQMVLGITLRSAIGDDPAGTQIGSIGLMFKPQFDHAEMGYSVGVDYWNKGYTTEAAAEMLRYAFEDLKLHRVHAHHYAENASSGRIMQKIGMRMEGTLREHIKKWGVYHDAVCYGMTVNDWKALPRK